MHVKVTQKNTEMQEAWTPWINRANIENTALDLSQRIKPGTLEFYLALERLLGKNSVLSEIIEAEKKA